MCFQNDNENYSSMSLQTIANNRRTFLHHKHNQLDVSDIEGARSRFIEKPRVIRQVYNNRNDDIEKTHSNIIIPKSVNKPDRQLMVDDIVGTRTKVNKFVTTRHIDPLNPIYQLPVVQYAPVPQTKFIRDNMVVDDIEGTRTKETFAIKLQRAGKVRQKDNTPLQKQKVVVKTNNFFLDVTDINLVQKPNRGNRCTNPLQPVYKLASTKQNCIDVQIGPIEGSHPSIQRQRRFHPDYNLNVKDIEGASSKNIRKVDSSKNDDIKEAKVGSYKRGISTNRKTNPLQPEYKYIGGSQFKNNYSRPKTAVQRFDAFIGK